MTRVLLDEDVKIRLRHQFGPEVEVETVQYRGWTGLDNGDLLDVAEEDFDVLVTLDASLSHQQNIANHRIAVAVLRPKSQRMEDLIDLVPELERRLPGLRSGKIATILPPR